MDISYHVKLLIIKITISSIVIGLKNSYFPLIHLPISISERHETIYFSFVSILMQIFPFFHNLAILLFSEIVIFYDILVINKSDSRCAVVRFCYHSYDYRPNWTPLSPITITNYVSWLLNSSEQLCIPKKIVRHSGSTYQSYCGQ